MRRVSALPRPRKRLSQHFLTDPRILGRIADALGAGADDTVVEIGPGRGSLTEHLVARAGRVVAIELDRELADLLRTRYASDRRVTIIQGNVLDVALAEAAGGPFLLAGNIPYRITTPILFHALERPRPARAVFLVQREVAERVVARPGSRAYGALSANVQAVAEAAVLFRVAAGAFTPAPSVESAVLRLAPATATMLALEEEVPFRSLVVRAFGFRRKQMKRVVRELWALDGAAAAALLARAEIAPLTRPEALGPADFARLLRARG